MPINKQEVISACREKLLERIKTAEEAMKRAQEAANGEEKSSAGDKYETSRAMGQLDRDMNARQLAEAKKELDILQKFDTAIPFTVAVPGAVIVTSEANYFMGAGLGVLKGSDFTFVAISPQAPISKLFAGKKENETVLFNGKQITIKQIL